MYATSEDSRHINDIILGTANTQKNTTFVTITIVIVTNKTISAVDSFSFILAPPFFGTIYIIYNY